jgi:integrase
MASVKALLYTSKKKSDGRHPIVLRIIKDRKPRYIYIDWVFEKDWDSKRLRVKISHPNSKRLNNLILKKIVEAEDLILESESLKKEYSSRQISKMIKGKRKNMTFFKLAEEYLDELQRSSKFTRHSADSGRINRFKEFLGGQDIGFHEIDESLLRKLKIYLISNNGVSERTVMNNFVMIRTLFNRAISEGIVEQKYYPFGKKKIRIKYPDASKIGLSKDEMEKIENLVLKENSGVWHTRNVFLFSFYLAGIRVSDVLRMKWNDIMGDRLQYKMGKNNKIDSLKLPEKVKTILSSYESDKQSLSDFIFPELKKAESGDLKDIHTKIRTANKKFNNYLKQIAKLAEIDKKITMHISRHSFGNIAGDKVSPQMLQKLYRHSSLSTTMGYQGNFIHKDTDEALDAVIN